MKTAGHVCTEPEKKIARKEQCTQKKFSKSLRNINTNFKTKSKRINSPVAAPSWFWEGNRKHSSFPPQWLLYVFESTVYWYRSRDSLLVCLRSKSRSGRSSFCSPSTGVVALIYLIKIKPRYGSCSPILLISALGYTVYSRCELVQVSCLKEGGGGLYPSQNYLGAATGELILLLLSLQFVSIFLTDIGTKYFSSTPRFSCNLFSCSIHFIPAVFLKISPFQTGKGPKN
jgi:hypothetical protein